MFENPNHHIMPGAEQSTHLSGGVVVVDREPTLVGVKATNRAAEILRNQGIEVPLRRHAVATLQFLAPFNRASLVRLLVALDRCSAAFGLTVRALVDRVFRPMGSLLFERSHLQLFSTTTYGVQAITP